MAAMRIIFLIGMMVLLGCVQEAEPVDIPDITPPVNHTEPVEPALPEPATSESVVETEENETLEEIPAGNETLSEDNATDEFCTLEQEEACERACEEDPEGQACFFECFLLVGCEE